MQQPPRAVVMIRPKHFHPNPDTAVDNAFQKSAQHQLSVMAERAYQEVTRMAQQLEAAGVRVHLLDDEATDRPDAVFPNNWFSTHAGGHVAIYPMAMASRQRELRWDVIQMLKTEYRVQDVIDYSGLAQDGIYLEGTGAMVLDHMARVAYAARSQRANPVALERFCTHFNYEPMFFDAADAQSQSVYHTNVLMCIGTHFAMAGFDMISDTSRRTHIMHRLRESGRELIELNECQIGEFAGNALELLGAQGLLLAMSSRAWRALNLQQRQQIEKYAQPMLIDVPTIELAGGSVRCMLAGIHLSPRL
jgi:hypothetical protein